MIGPTKITLQNETQITLFDKHTKWLPQFKSYETNLRGKWNMNKFKKFVDDEGFEGLGVGVRPKGRLWPINNFATMFATIYLLIVDKYEAIKPAFIGWLSAQPEKCATWNTTPLDWCVKQPRVNKIVVLTKCFIWAILKNFI